MAKNEIMNRNALWVVLLASACAANTPGMQMPAATVAAGDLERSLADSPPATEEAQVAVGARLFDRNCDACHGKRGEGNDTPMLEGPRVIGSDVLGTELNHGTGYANALQLHDYVANHLPNVKRRHLAQHEYWDVIAYMLYESEQPLQQRLDEDSARYVLIGSENLVASSELR